MIVTKERVFLAMAAVMSIINRKPRISQMAQFKIAKLHDALELAYREIQQANRQLTAKYGEEVFADDAKTVSKGWTLDPSSPNFQAYLDEWSKVLEPIVTIQFKPIPYGLLGESEHGLQAGEFLQLGEFIESPNEEVTEHVN